jgi:hypothetical protein
MGDVSWSLQGMKNPGFGKPRPSRLEFDFILARSVLQPEFFTRKVPTARHFSIPV